MRRSDRSYDAEHESARRRPRRDNALAPARRSDSRSDPLGSGGSRYEKRYSERRSERRGERQRDERRDERREERRGERRDERRSEKRDKTANAALPKKGVNMIEIICNDRLGKKVRVKCDQTDSVGELKNLIAMQTGTDAKKIVLKKWYTIFKNHISLADYEIHDGMNLELYYS